MLCRLTVPALVKLALMTALPLTGTARAVTNVQLRSDIGSWLSSQEAVAKEKIAGNLLPNGAVVAASSRSNPNYYFHWTRDAALTMEVVTDLYDAEDSGELRGRFLEAMTRYAGFVLKIQRENNLSGRVDDHFANAGEPKFEADGRAFNGPWGRPQSDGPALRALGLMRIYNLAQSDSEAQEALGSTTLNRIKTAIENDLDYVVHHWRDRSFDLWEEVRGDQFYNQLVQRRALIAGSNFFDGNLAQSYREQASRIGEALDNYWDDGRGYLVGTINRDGGIDYKYSNLDLGVILASLHAADSDDRYFDAVDSAILATAHRLRSTFKSIYGINRNEVDASGHKMSPAIGRYPEDKYDGNGFDGGNPWFLGTAALAELHYRAATQYVADGKIVINDRNLGFFRDLPSTGNGLRAGETVSAGQPRFNKLIKAIIEEGDNYLARVRRHIGPGGSMSEQLDRETGFMRGAPNLSWSYASVLTAAKARRKSLQALRG